MSDADDNGNRGVKIEIELVSKRDVLRADADGTSYGRNADAGRLMAILLNTQVFGKNRTTAALERLMYVEEPSAPQDTYKGRSQKASDKTYGYNRIRNLAEGKASFTPEEAKILHDAFRWSFGDVLADAIPVKELVTAPIKTTMRKVVAASAAWPKGRLTPAVAFEVMTAMQNGNGLSIRPALTDTLRLGGPKNGPNANLVPDMTMPYYEPGATYVLHVRGLKAGAERCFALEIAHDAQVEEDGGNEPWIGFPVDHQEADTANWSIWAGPKKPFEFYDNKGQFTFVALSFPTDWDIVKVFGVDPDAVRINAEEMDGFAVAVRTALIAHPDALRVASYSYQVA